MGFQGQCPPALCSPLLLGLRVNVASLTCQVLTPAQGASVALRPRCTLHARPSAGAEWELGCVPEPIFKRLISQDCFC